MEDDQYAGYGAASVAPAIVFLTPFSPYMTPSPRRLSSNFIEPSRPVRAARQLSWVSLQGRLIGAEEASSARTIGGGLEPREAAAWELFSPVQRILIVAVVATAVAGWKKSRLIGQLRRSVDLRDQILSSMQQKLDDLCEQLNNMKDRPETKTDMPFTKNEEFISAEAVKSDETKLHRCGCQLCNHHQGDFVDKISSGDDMFKYNLPLVNAAEQEERRMSDLSDWASSVTSAADIQVNVLALEQDMHNLKKEKDATIKQLSSVVHESEFAGPKRISELEEIIRRKNMVIKKLKKDMMFLEQKVVQLIRIRRPSSTSSSEARQLPVLADNLLYDMDSTTSSSSDSDCPAENRSQGPVAKKIETQDIPHRQNSASPRISRSQHSAGQKEAQDIAHSKNTTSPRMNRSSPSAKTPTSFAKSMDKHPKQHFMSPLKENSMNQRPNSWVTLRPKQLISAGGDIKRNRRHILQPKPKEMGPGKRWV